MPRHRSPQSPKVVHRTARSGLRVTRAQRRRLVELLVSAGDVWACVLELNAWRRARQDRPLVSYQSLCRELAASGTGTFGELDSAGARSVLRRYSDAWFAAAQRRREGDRSARFPRRRRALMSLCWYHDRFTLEGRRLQIPVTRGCPPLWVRLDRDLPYPPEQVRSVTLLYDAGRLWVDVTAEVPVACYPAEQEPHPARVAGAPGQEADAPRWQPSPEEMARMRATNEAFFEHLLRPTTYYRPDIEALRAAPTRIVVARGATSAGTLPNRTAVALAGRLGTTAVDFPGDHVGFMFSPEQFGRVLHQVLSETPSQ